MPCAIEIVREMQGDEKAKELTNIRLSNDIVKSRISSVSDDILERCTARLRDNDFGIQLDEPTCVQNVTSTGVCALCVGE